jgi:hypothetical protein
VVPNQEICKLSIKIHYLVELYKLECLQLISAYTCSNNTSDRHVQWGAMACEISRLKMHIVSSYNVFHVCHDLSPTHERFRVIFCPVRGQSVFRIPKWRRSIMNRLSARKTKSACYAFIRRRIPVNYTRLSKQSPRSW